MVEIEETVEWWKAIVQSMNDGVLVIDRKGIVKTINPEYTRITGVNPDIIGEPLLAHRPGAQLPETLKDGKSRVGVYRKTRGREYVVDMAPILLDGEIIGAVSVCKSLNEVHKLTKELAEQQEKVAELERHMSSIYKVRYTFEDIITKDTQMKHIMTVAQKAAGTDLPILIAGESGTGKELFAQAVHHTSLRRDKPFIPVNCSAIPETLIENELFGHAEGAFHGALAGGKAGLFEMADGGTLFLDEIGDLSMDVQAKILRALQEGRIRRIGDAAEQRVDVRIVAATHRDVTQMITKGLFRSELFYRLNVVSMQIPALRERKGDIPLLLQSFLPAPYTVERDVMDLLTSYEWPGNVRELKNVIDFAVCMTEDGQISTKHLPEFMRKLLPLYAENSSLLPLHRAVEKAEKTILTNALRNAGTTVPERTKLAEDLGISLATLYNKMKKYNLS
ncbi:hypothetical protein NCCP2222_35710 [Sporosarcina sp. NCCP-2222]|uniref:sigma-54 interaction domain-containing protein n=1 Tax=Sporosarcina sp. NCCP-2222 TaxID=2935073 RepID=UPI0020899EF5|nr:sigma 54-interacting transcriptional regulator [Sporosarcina sp. NCCP-2222]GKV57624.1 hypothetical protein NCCP2222_35710 [Sporosarcina sp. NCCP-2222]